MVFEKAGEGGNQPAMEDQFRQPNLTKAMRWRGARVERWIGMALHVCAFAILFCEGYQSNAGLALCAIAAWVIFGLPVTPMAIVCMWGFSEAFEKLAAQAGIERELSLWSFACANLLVWAWWAFRAVFFRGDWGKELAGPLASVSWSRIQWAAWVGVCLWVGGAGFF